MRLQDFPNCCTAKILTGLGRSATAGYSGDFFENDHDFCERAIQLIQERARMGTALIFAITVTDQVMAARCLPQIGFEKVMGDVDKIAHQGSKLTSWIYRCTKEDATPKAPVANPFAKPVPPKPVAPAIPPQDDLAEAALAGVRQRQLDAARNGGWHPMAPVLRRDVVAKRIGDTIMHRFAAETARDVESWYANNNRKEVNDELRRRFRRDPNSGRFLRLPVAGVIYTREQLNDFFIPMDMRYRRIMDEGVGNMRSIGSRKAFSGMGLGNVPHGAATIAYVFA